MRTILMSLLFLFANSRVERIPDPPWKTFYVKPDGVESADGLSRSQATTLRGARDKIRTLSGPWAGNVEVILDDGIYYESSTLFFDEEDSGRDGYSVIYRNAPGCSPVISHSQELDAGWTVSNACWCSSSSFTNLNFRDLSTGIDAPDTRAVLARSDIVLRDAALLKEDPVYPGTIRVSKSALVTNAVNALAAGHPLEIKIYHKWAHSIVGIESMDLPPGEYAYLTPRASQRNRMFYSTPNTTLNSDYYKTWYSNSSILYSYRFQNSLEFLDEPGEFWKGDACLYYKPRPGENPTNLVTAAPAGVRLMEVKGSSATNRVQDIVFYGITFSETTWRTPTYHGFLGTQAVGFYDYSGARSHLPLAVLIKHADRIDFTHCRFARLATTALGYFSGASACDVEGCHFRDIGGAALELYGAATLFNESLFDEEDEVVENCRIVNNFIQSCGVVYEMTPAIVGVMGPGHLVAHNEIAGGPYSGISWGWGLGREMYADSPLWDNEIKANSIHGTFEVIQDGAGIYTYGNHQDGLLLFENYIADLQRSAYAESDQPICGLYFDGGTYEVTARRNVLENIDDYRPPVFFHMFGNSTTFPDGTPIIKTNYTITAEEAEYHYDVVSVDNDITDQAVKDRAGLQADWAAITNQAAAPPPGIINIALNQKVSASHTNMSLDAAFVPDRGADDDPATILASGSVESGDAPDYRVDFNRPCRIGLVELVSRTGYDQPFARRNFAVEGLVNGTNWVLLAGQGEEAFGAEETWCRAVTNTAAYGSVRIRKTEPEAMNFAEFRIYSK